MSGKFRLGVLDHVLRAVLMIGELKDPKKDLSSIANLP